MNSSDKSRFRYINPAWCGRETFLVKVCASGKAMVKSSREKEWERKRQKAKRQRQRIAQRQKKIEEQLCGTLPIGGQEGSPLNFSSATRGTYIFACV